MATVMRLGNERAGSVETEQRRSQSFPNTRRNPNDLLDYVRHPVAESLTTDVLANHGGTVSRNAEGVGQGRACWNPGTERLQHARQLFHPGGGGPSKSFATELIAAPAHYSSIV